MNKQIKTSAIIFVAFCLSGCEDVLVMRTYDSHPVEQLIISSSKHEQESIFSVGDRPFQDSSAEKICFVPPLADLNSFSIFERQVSFSNSFYFVVELHSPEDEEVTIFHSGYLRVSGGGALCTSEPSKLVVSGVNQYRITISLGE